MKKTILIRFLKITAIYLTVFIFILGIRRFYVCPFKNILGIECFGCGMTRAFFAILNLDFASAFSLNPFIFPLFAGVILFYFYYIFAGKALSKR